MPIQDVLTPNLQNASLGDHLSDKFLGTNKKNNIETMNNYELQKAINVNKYAWNAQGMKAAGINPIAAPSQLGNVATSQAEDKQGDGGFLVNEVLDTLKALSPSSTIKEMRKLKKEFVKSIFK